MTTGVTSLGERRGRAGATREREFRREGEPSAHGPSSCGFTAGLSDRPTILIMPPNGQQLSGSPLLLILKYTKRNIFKKLYKTNIFLKQILKNFKFYKI